MVAPVRNNKGFSLVELMIALVILQISLLGLLSGLVNSIAVNLNNELRNTTIRITNQTAEAIHSLDFNDNEVTAGTHYRDPYSSSQNLKGFPQTVQDIRGGFQQNYNISWAVTDPGTELKQVLITVQYTNPRGENLSNNAVIYKHRAL
ncbi:MAG: hypothetical protein COS40_11175 [Deltaproteobacteria bacterium CG03_land_8_20_14_0_80_45_14]|nr:MAG: hypothetical protein COS40_11175 [Deltaproteobacteria bacterium CG03_land_8_20_14_0_80_45_14]